MPAVGITVIGSIGLVGAGVVGLARGGASAAPAYRVVPSTGQALATITAFQLGQMGWSIGPPTRSAAVSSTQATSIAQGLWDDSVEEVTLATCGVVVPAGAPVGTAPPFAGRLCWVVSTRPSAATAIPLQGPTNGEMTKQRLTVEAVLVDALTGRVLQAGQNAFPAAA